MMQQTVDSLRRRKSSVHPYAQFDEDSDIGELATLWNLIADLAAPLEEVAYKSRILSPNSRLLLRSRSSTKSSQSSRRTSTISSSSLRSGVGLTSGKGWSGSESEEEEWSTSLRLLQNRKVRKSVIPRPVWAKQADRLSQASQTSTLSTMSTMTADSGVSHASTELLTPSGSTDMPHALAQVAPKLRRTGSSASTSSTSTIPGNFAWGKSSPDQSPRLTATQGAGRRSSARSVSSGGAANLPTPTREVTGWGEPEKMFGETTDDEADMDAKMGLGPELDDETPRPSAANMVPAPVSQAGAYIYQAAAHIEDRLAGLFGRAPLPRSVSDPTTGDKAAAATKSKIPPPKVESRIPRPRPVSVVRPKQEEQQCAACRFF
jgi:hypothetical protein